MVPKAAQAIHRISYALIFLIIIQTIHAFFNALIEFTETDPKFKGKPLKGYIQILTLMLYIIAILVIIAILTGQSPWVLLSGIGALTAVILLIFRETILSFVASLQISSYKLVKKNDWIEAPQYGADGDVIDISLHTVKVQNWDKTITVIPTHKLIEGSFKNWRGMEECGGRRIKRSFYIDINSIRFCDKKMVEKFKKVSLLKDYIEQKQNEIDAYNREKGIDLGIKINGRRLTNVGTFRAYIQAYLKDHHQINHNLTFLIRQLQSGPTGLPIEIYVFTNTIEWVQYEAIQADIFDHILAVAKEFDLKIFQYPSDNSANKVVFADPN